MEAHQQFNFIDPLWIPSSGRSLCPDDKIKKIIDIINSLTQILVKQLVPDFDLKITQYHIKRSFPAWWQTFKKDWDKAVNTNIEFGMDKRYHIDAINWICSYPAYFHSLYILCKHLVAKKNISPAFMEIKQRYDYPLIFFDEESCPDSGNLQNVELVERNSAKNEIEVKLAYYEKVFNSALKLYQKEKDNAQFVKSFNTFMKLVVKSIKECEKKPNACT
ncbi:hypothetical protein RhiirA4_473128 [Rhizophagus irregularis]|uniref:Uncharacterized protein n=1 Tax=Rhizophagus irregularis TaxID=588596 RepID=A0A2I1H656_9GLOM|nr:hypothetical protein RhiirA4_473128 [Rhizophagus irregularis]